jgi:ferredoxin
MQDDMRDSTDADRKPCSRLSCQIRMSAALGGIRVTVPRA